MYVFFICCLGGTIALASLCLHFTFGGACYRHLKFFVQPDRTAHLELESVHLIGVGSVATFAGGP